MFCPPIFFHKFYVISLVKLNCWFRHKFTNPDSPQFTYMFQEAIPVDWQKWAMSP